MMQSQPKDPIDSKPKPSLMSIIGDILAKAQYDVSIGRKGNNELLKKVAKLPPHA
jgi:hypothetical protein